MELFRVAISRVGNCGISSPEFGASSGICGNSSPWLWSQGQGVLSLAILPYIYDGYHLLFVVMASLILTISFNDLWGGPHEK